MKWWIQSVLLVGCCTGELTSSSFHFQQNKTPRALTISPEVRSWVKREVGLGSRSLAHSYPVPNKPHGFCGRKAPRKKKTTISASCQTLAESQTMQLSWSQFGTPKQAVRHCLDNMRFSFCFQPVELTQHPFEPVFCPVITLRTWVDELTDVIDLSCRFPVRNTLHAFWLSPW